MQKTYKMANLRGLTMNMGVNISPIQVANIAKAASKRPPNTSSRSHRLTTDSCQQRSTWLIINERYDSLQPKKSMQELSSVTFTAVARPSVVMQD